MGMFLPHSHLMYPTVGVAIPTDYLAYYSMDNISAGVLTDDSGNGYDGTISGATQVAGQFGGSALSFDGVNDGVDINGIPDNISTLTAVAWVNTANTTSSKMVFSHRSSSPLIQANIGANTASLLARDTTLRQIGASSSITNGSWHSVGYVVAPSLLQIWINGIKEVESTDSWGSSISATLTSIGYLAYSDSEWFDGLIQRLRLYSRVLTSDEFVAIASES